jgi:hypothetical protein
MLGNNQIPQSENRCDHVSALEGVVGAKGTASWRREMRQCDVLSQEEHASVCCAEAKKVSQNRTSTSLLNAETISVAVASCSGPA